MVCVYILLVLTRLYQTRNHDQSDSDSHSWGPMIRFTRDVDE